MIQLEDRFIEVFKTIPNITFQGVSLNTKYDFGTEKDCVQFLTVNTSKDKYPLVWLETPINLKGKEPILNTRLKFILAYPTESEMENRQRLDTYFADVLDPLYNYVITALQQCGFVSFINQVGNTFARHYNFTDASNNKSQFPDIWDAIVFARDVRIDTSCKTKTINY
ncbi:MAG: hypothetical protein CMC76_12025 [Flavobacteriaceae bacterium]|nr:hypothetical protein [Flavobacteriaceae bacterium]|tara:strand:+ start:168 stop:671 length:504 start_codon:yes stop_codon:yes gene_type:complete